MKKILTSFFLTILFTSIYSQYEKLPKWASNIPKSSKSAVYAIGISDTKLDEQTAYKQAIFRAKIILSMLNNAKAMQSKDYFTISRNDMSCQKMQRLGKIESSSLFDTINVTIVKKEYNKFNEAIVLIKQSIIDENAQIIDSLQVLCDSYLQETGIGNGFDFIRSFKLDSYIKSNSDSTKFLYECYDNNNEIRYSVTYNDTTYNTPGTVYEYNNTKDQSDIQTTDYQGVSDLKKGLWKAYIDVVIQSILSHSDLVGSTSKKSGDNYVNDETSTTGKDEKLSREISSNNLSFYIRNIDIVDNKMMLNLSLTTTQKKSWLNNIFSKN